MRTRSVPRATIRPRERVEVLPASSGVESQRRFIFAGVMFGLGGFGSC